jgi:uncharacterized membrane protein YiaA
MKRDEMFLTTFLFVAPITMVVGLLIYDIIHYPDNFLGYFLAQLILFLIIGIPILKMLFIFIMAILLKIPPIGHRIEKSEWYNRC